MQIITKADVQNYMGILIDSSLDGFVDTLIGSAQSFIEEYTDREFSVDDVDTTNYYDGNGLTTLNIDDLRTPTSVVVDGVALTLNDDYFLLPYKDTVKTQIRLSQPATRLNSNSRISSSSPYIFEEGQRNIVITGKFGYSVTAPDPIKTAGLAIVSAYLKQNISDKDVKEINSESLGDYSVTYSKVSEVADKPSITSILDLYKRDKKKKSSVSMSKI
jgi:hypothetical protein